MNAIRLTLSLILTSLTLQIICSQPLSTVENFSDYGFSGRMITEFTDHITLGEFRYEFYPINSDTNMQMNKASASAWGDNGYLQIGSFYKDYQEIKELRIINTAGNEFSFINLMASEVNFKEKTEFLVSGYRDNVQVTETYRLSIDALRPGKLYYFYEFEGFKKIDEIRFTRYINNLKFFIEHWTYQYTSNTVDLKIEQENIQTTELNN